MWQERAVHASTLLAFRSPTRNDNMGKAWLVCYFFYIRLSDRKQSYDAWHYMETASVLGPKAIL